MARSLVGVVFAFLPAASLAQSLDSNLLRRDVTSNVATGSAPKGAIDSPADKALIGTNFTIAGWATGTSGLRAVEARIGSHRFLAVLGIRRPDVEAIFPSAPNAATSGYSVSGVVPQIHEPQSDRQTIRVVAIGGDGAETTIGQRTLINPIVFQRWRNQSKAASMPFYVLPALSGIKLGGADGLAREYAQYVSSTIRVGMRVPILYMRTTLGREQDFRFDPDWDIARKCAKSHISEDNLNTTISYAIQHRLPTLFTLNGGIWADSSCDVPEWDVNDFLEANPMHCQWNQFDQVMPDDYLKGLPGSQESPELGRALTLNIYAAQVRKYKRRNLVAAAKIIAKFARSHPDLFVGVTLDPDTYINPFFAEKQWYDFNPGTLRQFRHWLAGSGPYAGRPDGPMVPNLRQYRRPNVLTLAKVSEIARRNFANWDAVDPPRSFERTSGNEKVSFWNDPWVREWEHFRRHLVHLHYSELAGWVTEAGVPPERVWSGQGFMAPVGEAKPFAINLLSPPQNYDSGGMSIEGAIPKKGHLGAILYGASAVNDVQMETPSSLFATFRRMDSRWGALEYNTADLRSPKSHPTYAAAYRGLRDLFNFGATIVSPMAWNGSNGLDSNSATYSTFTAWRNTPLEDATRDFMLSHANLARPSRLWTFGTDLHRDDDGWSTEQSLTLMPGHIRVRPIANLATLISPRELGVPQNWHLVLGLADSANIVSIALAVKLEGTESWRRLRINPTSLVRSPRRMIVPLKGAFGMASGIDQLRVQMRLRNNEELVIDHIALLPHFVR